jgi:hypothetical protein
VVVQFERFRIALEDSELVAEHDNLEVLGLTGSGSRSGEADEEPVEEPELSSSLTRIRRSAGTADIFGAHRPCTDS